MKWRQASGVLCDKRVPQKLKGKFYRTAIRPATLYGAECWPTKRRHVQQISVAEMRMLRWICGHTRRDRVRNDDIRDRLGVAPIEEKLVQYRLRWFGHVQRRPQEAPVRSRILSQDSNVKRGRGRPKLTWVETIKEDLKGWNISKDLALDRSAWKTAIHVPEPWLLLLCFNSILPQLVWDLKVAVVVVSLSIYVSTLKYIFEKQRRETTFLLSSRITKLHSYCHSISQNYNF